MEEQKGKILIASSLLLTVLAATVLLLFVMPGLTGSGRSEAQEPPGAGGPPGGAPAGGPGSPPAPGGGAPGGPGSPPSPGGGAPGGPPMGGGAPGGGAEMGMGGAPGGGMGGAGGGAPAAAAGPADPRALEGSRPNPFMPRGEVGPATGELKEPPLTHSYGTNWHRLPSTARLGFPRPNIPARTVAQPPAPTEEPSFDITVTSILWTQDGQAMAVYESGGKSGVVKPGDIVGGWQVAEIWRDRVIVSDTKSGRRQSVYLTTKSATPKPPSGGGGGTTPGGGGRGRRPGAPAGGGGGAAPPGGFPAPGG